MMTMLPTFKKIRLPMGLPLVLMAASLAGVPPLALAVDAPTASKSNTTTGRAATAAQDKEMEATIRAKLLKSKIGKDGFKVRVQGGVAYWEGSTEVVQHKGSATRMAKSAGATRVVNNIKVGDAARLKASDNLEQGRRRAQIKRSDASEGSKRSDPRSQ
jgi:hypothetical protein